MLKPRGRILIVTTGLGACSKALVQAFLMKGNKNLKRKIKEFFSGDRLCVEEVKGGDLAFWIW